MWATGSIILSIENAIMVVLTNVQLQQANREFFFHSDIFAIAYFIIIINIKIMLISNDYINIYLFYINPIDIPN